MKKLITNSLLLLAICLLTQSVLAQNNDKEKNKELLIKATQILEVDPFVDKAKDFRSWAMSYIIQTDDVSVLICTNGITPLIEKKYKYANEMLAQYTMGMAAFKLSNPNNKDDNAAQVAGIESALKSYESILKTKPKTKYASIDDLISKRDKGELKLLVESAKCGEGKTESIK